ncbi:hypothetical protein ACKWTF_002076 [Chironomus riparius]
MNERLTRKRTAEKKEAGEQVTFDSIPYNLKRRRTEKRVNINEQDTNLHISPLAASTPIEIDRNNLNHQIQDIEMATAPENQKQGESLLNRAYIQNFPIDYNDLTGPLKKLARKIRNQPNEVQTDAMNRIFTEEYASKALGNNIYSQHEAVTTKETYLAIQEAIIDLQSWSASDWTDQNNIKIAESLLESCFDTICHAIIHTSEELKPKLHSAICELDVLYNQMIKMTRQYRIQSPLTSLRIENPLINNNAITTSTPLLNPSQIPAFPSPNPNIIVSPPINSPTYSQPINPPINLSQDQNHNQRRDNNVTFDNFPYQNTPNRTNPGFPNSQRTTTPTRNQNRQQYQPNTPSFQWPTAQSQTNPVNTPNRHNLTPITAFGQRFDDSAYKITQTIKNWPYKFDGSQGNVSQHIQTWLSKATTEITPELILENVEFLLEGKALTWHRIFGTSIKNWYDYANTMHAYFTSGKTESELEADFQDSRHDQKDKENFIVYITRLKSEANKLSCPVSDDRMFERIKRGLRSEYFPCKMAATNLTDLMAKCHEFEAIENKKKQKVTSSNNFEWLKDKFTTNTATSSNTHKWNSLRSPKTNLAPSFRPKSPFKAKNQVENPNKKPFWTSNNRKFVNNKQQQPNQATTSKTTAAKSINEMETDETSSDYEAELTRGRPRAINDDDIEYIQKRSIELTEFTQMLDLNEYQINMLAENSRCENCHENGHFINDCEDALRGIWFEHCKICKTADFKGTDCQTCEKNL